MVTSSALLHPWLLCSKSIAPTTPRSALSGAKSGLSRFQKKRRRLDERLKSQLFGEVHHENEAIGGDSVSSSSVRCERRSGQRSEDVSPATTPPHKKRAHKNPHTPSAVQSSPEDVSARLYSPLADLDKAMTKDKLARHLRARPGPNASGVRKARKDTPITPRRATVDSREKPAGPSRFTKSQAMYAKAASDVNLMRASGLRSSSFDSPSSSSTSRQSPLSAQVQQDNTPKKKLADVNSIELEIGDDDEDGERTTCKCEYFCTCE